LTSYWLITNGWSVICFNIPAVFSYTAGAELLSCALTHHYKPKQRIVLTRVWVSPEVPLRCGMTGLTQYAFIVLVL